MSRGGRIKRRLNILISIDKVEHLDKVDKVDKTEMKSIGKEGNSKKGVRR